MSSFGLAFRKASSVAFGGQRIFGWNLLGILPRCQHLFSQPLGHGCQGDSKYIHDYNEWCVRATILAYLELFILAALTTVVLVEHQALVQDIHIPTVDTVPVQGDLCAANIRKRHQASNQ